MALHHVSKKGHIVNSAVSLSSALKGSTQQPRFTILKSTSSMFLDFVLNLYLHEVLNIQVPTNQHLPRQCGSLRAFRLSRPLLSSARLTAPACGKLGVGSVRGEFARLLTHVTPSCGKPEDALLLRFLEIRIPSPPAATLGAGHSSSVV